MTNDKIRLWGTVTMVFGLITIHPGLGFIAVGLIMILGAWEDEPVEEKPDEKLNDQGDQHRPA